VVLEQQRAQVLKDNLVFSKRILDVARSKYEIGKFSRLDFLTAQVDYNTDSSNYLAQTEQLNNLKVELNQLIGRSPSIEYSVAADIQFDQTLDEKTLLDKMLDMNPLLKQLQSGKTISYLQLQELKSQRYPAINLNAGYGYSSSSAEAGFLVSRQAFGPTFGISARWNIFNGNNLNRQQQNAEINTEIADITIEEAKIELEAALRKAFIQYKNSIALINLEKTNLQVAMEREQIAFDRYEIGNSSALEVREAQLNRLNAEIRYLNVLYNAKISETELLRVSGTILNE
jgi:outer membrane protein TolC